MARVVFDAVTKRFGDVTALREFSLEIEDGEFVEGVPDGRAAVEPGCEAGCVDEDRDQAPRRDAGASGVHRSDDRRGPAVHRARRRRHPVRAGKQVRFGLEPGRLHLFDVTTQQALGIV
jgi:hypothetical protein